MDDDLANSSRGEAAMLGELALQDGADADAQADAAPGTPGAAGEMTDEDVARLDEPDTPSDADELTDEDVAKGDEPCYSVAEARALPSPTASEAGGTATRGGGALGALAAQYEDTSEDEDGPLEAPTMAIGTWNGSSIVPSPAERWVHEAPALFASGADIGKYQLQQVMKSLSRASPAFRNLRRECFVRPAHRADLGPVYLIFHPSFSCTGSLKDVVQEAGGQWRETDFGDATLATPLGPIKIEVARPPPGGRGPVAPIPQSPLGQQAGAGKRSTVPPPPWQDKALAYPEDEVMRVNGSSSTDTGVWAISGE
jgi:hypothetical protein